jgi:hypothetical protein
MGVWTASAWICEPPLGVVALICALAVFRLSLSQFREAWRLVSLAELENHHETRRTSAQKIRL